ncbi:MAG: S41 family peptidase, partial [bacterium]|nr:S41 family peptidase [bacterium]
KNASQELKAALLQVLNKKVKGIIMDLRNDPGGLLDVAVEVSDQFIREGLIVSIKPREDTLSYNSFLKKEFYATGNNVVPVNLPLVVLVNSGSASASEIFAGAIKDHKRGILIGTKTFGKGSVQSVINLDAGYGLRFTTAYYYTPAGIKIHQIGIEPDIEIELPQLSKEEVKQAKRLIDEKIIEDFVKKNKLPTEKETDSLMDDLKNRNIDLNKMIVKRMIRQEQYKDKKEPLYDLSFDTQLKMAIEIINAELIFKKQ